MFSCSDLVEKISSKLAEEKKNQNILVWILTEEGLKKEIGEYYAGVDQLRVRKYPNLNKKVKTVTSLKEGEKVFFMGIESNEIFEVKLRVPCHERSFSTKLKLVKEKLDGCFQEH